MRTSGGRGLIAALLAATAFGLSGTLAKPLLETGWSPAAAVTARSLIGGAVLLVPALVVLRGRLRLLWRARRRILVMGLVGVAATQLAYFAAIGRIQVGTAILIEYTAPLLLVALAWARTRRRPRGPVLAGSAVALAGLVLVVSPSGAGLDAIGVLLAAAAAVGCAAYYVVAARPDDGLPAVALASAGLLLGGIALGALGATGLVPLTIGTGTVAFAGTALPWWVPLVVLGVVATGFAYGASITASEALGSQLASFAGLLEVVTAAAYSWLLLGETMGPLQLLGGGAIVTGIALVRSERRGRTIEADARADVATVDVDPPVGA